MLIHFLKISCVHSSAAEDWRLREPPDKGTKILQNVSNYLPVDVARNARRRDTSFIFLF